MLRVALSRLAPVIRTAAVRQPVCHARPTLAFARYNSNQSPAGKPKAHEIYVDWSGPKLSYEQVKQRSEQPSPNAYLVDVREPDEVILGSIPSSVNLPLSTIAEGLHLNPVSFKDKYGFEKPKKDQEIVFYCRSGKRSATASDVAKRNGYTNIFNYEGSWLDWTAREKDRSS